MGRPSRSRCGPRRSGCIAADAAADPPTARSAPPGPVPPTCSTSASGPVTVVELDGGGELVAVEQNRSDGDAAVASPGPPCGWRGPAASTSVLRDRHGSDDLIGPIDAVPPSSTTRGRTHDQIHTRHRARRYAAAIAVAAAIALVAAGCGSSSKRHRARATTRPRRPPLAGSRSARARARSTSSPGRATPRTARTTRPSTGSTPFETEPAARSVKIGTPPTRCSS